MARLMEGGQSTRGGGFVASALQPRALVEDPPNGRVRLLLAVWS